MRQQPAFRRKPRKTLRSGLAVRQAGVGHLRIEAPGAIITVMADQKDAWGRPCTVIEVNADGNRHVGYEPWWIEGRQDLTRTKVRVIEGPGRLTAENEENENVE